MPSHIFYEVRDIDGNAMWGGESAKECYDFFRRNEPLLSIWVSEWEGEGEDLHENTKAINITPLFHAVRLGTMKEVQEWVLQWA